MNWEPWGVVEHSGEVVSYRRKTKYVDAFIARGYIGHQVGSWYVVFRGLVSGSHRLQHECILEAKLEAMNIIIRKLKERVEVIEQTLWVLLCVAGLEKTI